MTLTLAKVDCHSALYLYYQQVYYITYQHVLLFDHQPLIYKCLSLMCAVLCDCLHLAPYILTCEIQLNRINYLLALDGVL